MLRRATVAVASKLGGSRSVALHTMTVGIAGLLVLLATCSFSASPPTGPRAHPPGERPNILLIVTDDQRADMLWTMPSLLRRVGDRGIRFREGFVPHALCCPARASILTGNHSHTTGVWSNKLVGGYGAFDESSTLATWLDDAGYRTGFFGKYLNHWVDPDPTHVPPGWDAWFAFMEHCCSYYGFTASVNGEPKTFADRVYSTTESARRAAAFISSAGPDPAFVLWAPAAPHHPVTPETRYEGTLSGLEPFRPPNYLEPDVSDKPKWVQGQSRWEPRRRVEVDALRRRMLEALQSVDDGIDVLLDALESSGRLSDTLIVFTSDNGFLLGEHRMQGKPFPWDSGHRVPFLVRYDRLVEEPVSSKALVLTVDIAPTIVEIAGVSAPSMEGRSLVPILRRDAGTVRSMFPIEHSDTGIPPPYCGARSLHALFVRYPTGEEEFYDYRRDPWELHNAVSDPAHRDPVERHRRFARANCDPVPPGFSW